jgi:hypothetical protein
MDFGNYWQENKRFLTSVAFGAVVFLGAWTAIDRTLGAQLREARASKVRLEADLKKPMFAATDLDRAQQDNDQLVAACSALRKSIEFVARPEFRMEKGVPATSRYFNVVERTLEDLKRKSGRAGLTLPADLGMPAIAPTKEIELARYLEALDAIDQTIHAAITSGCTRIDSIRVKLDARLLTGKSFADVEKTLVEFKLTGASLPMALLLERLQDTKGVRVLQIEKVDIEPARAKIVEDVAMNMTVLVAHLNAVGETASAEEPK